MKHKIKHYSYSIYQKREMALGFDKEKLENEVSRMFLDEQQKWILKKLSNIKNKKILDVGAGTGRISIPLASAGANVTALDASDEMLNIARAKAKKSNIKIKFRRGDAHKLPFSDYEFDSVISIRTLMHFVNWKKALSEICRVSKKNVVLDFPPVLGLTIFAPLYLSIKKIFIKDTQNYRLFTLSAVKKELIRNNFMVEDIKRQYVLPLFLHKYINSINFSKASQSFFSSIGFVYLFGAPVTIYARRVKNTFRLEGNYG